MAKIEWIRSQPRPPDEINTDTPAKDAEAIRARLVKDPECGVHMHCFNRSEMMEIAECLSIDDRARVQFSWWFDDLKE